MAKGFDIVNTEVKLQSSELKNRLPSFFDHLKLSADKDIGKSVDCRNRTEETETSDSSAEQNKEISDDKHETKGGSYKEVKKNSEGSTHEVHHMPADSTSDIDRQDGPAIRMTKEDHAETASYGSSRDAKEYREKQKELIEQGKFIEALKMDIEDVIDKFGDKYNEEIKEMLEYVKELVDKGIITDEDNLLDELFEMIENNNTEGDGKK